MLSIAILLTVCIIVGVFTLIIGIHIGHFEPETAETPFEQWLFKVLRKN